MTSRISRNHLDLQTFLIYLQRQEDIFFKSFQVAIDKEAMI
jgi:IS1 family transposase